MSKDDCLQARKTCDDDSTYSPEQLLIAEQHLRSCSDCEAWRKQWNVIADAARDMPMFDVPEALTQRILSEVKEEQVGKAITGRNLVLSLVVALPALMMFWSDSFDTASGFMAWAVGLVFLVGLNWLLQMNTKYETRLQ